MDKCEIMEYNALPENLRQWIETAVAPLQGGSQHEERRLLAKRLEARYAELKESCEEAGAEAALLEELGAPELVAKENSQKNARNQKVMFRNLRIVCIVIALFSLTVLVVWMLRLSGPLRIRQFLPANCVSLLIISIMGILYSFKKQ